MIAYCGINCLKCPSYIATQSGSSKKLNKVAEQLSKLYRAEVKPEYVICDGCKADKRLSYFCSNLCKMKPCCIQKGYDSCIECLEYPCKELQAELDHSPDAKNNLEKLRRPDP